MTLTNRGKQTITILDRLSILGPELGWRILKEIIASAEKFTKKRAPIDTASMVSTVRKKFVKAKLFGSILVGGIWAKFSRSGKERKFVNYAKFVNDGTSKQAGQFFLDKGVMDAVREKNSIGKKAFNNWIRVAKKT